MIISVARVIAKLIQSGESTHIHDHVIMPVSLRTINTMVKRPVKPIPVPVLLLLLLLLIFHSPFCFFILYLYTSSCICLGGVAGLRCARKYSRCAFLLILSYGINFSFFVIFIDFFHFNAVHCIFIFMVKDKGDIFGVYFLIYVL